MAHQSELISQDIEAYLKEHENKEICRFITCGSVDDGKSTLIGRLLYDSKMTFEDQLTAIEKDSKKSGRTGDKIDLALLVDGLASEREQGITIDVAYRYFSTEKRKFIIADTPGHKQYTRNMATGASRADIAIILIDARKGVLTQTKRHSYIVSLLGIKNLIVAINKMDLVDFSQKRFEEIKEEYQKIIPNLPHHHDINFTYIPISALDGDNIVTNSHRCSWYNNPPLMALLNTLEIQNSTSSIQNSFRMPVQYVNRPHLNFRGFCGTIASGTISVGDSITVLPSKKSSKVKSIISNDIKDLRVKNKDETIETITTAFAPMATTLTLEDEIDISRGDMIVKSDNIPKVSNKFSAMVVWMSEEKLSLNSSYIIKRATSVINGVFTSIDYKKDINSFEELKTDELGLNDIAKCTLSLDRAIAVDSYEYNRYTGSFIIIDRYTNETVGAGMIVGLIMQSNLFWHNANISKKDRITQLSQKPYILWFTGLSGSGKSTIANAVESKLFEMNYKTYLLDGDNIRHRLNKDLGFSDDDRIENIRRIGEVAKLFVDSGTIVLSAFISPFQKDRDLARSLVEKEEFIEVFIDTPLEVCENRDAKGLYKKARSGEIPNFTGISSPYEAPKNAELVIKNDKISVEEAAQNVIDYLKEKGYLNT